MPDEKLSSSSPETPARDWQALARRLVGVTLAYNVLEAVVGIWAALVSGSVALLGFGLDSVIETSAAALMLWRLSPNAGADAARREHSVHRFVGVSFLVLAVYVVGDATLALWRSEPPLESRVGIALAALSLVIMPVVSFAKLRVAAELNSAALRAEAKETLACSYLSLALLLGLAANALAGWWWADPVAALLMVPWLIKEGHENVYAEEACCEPT